MNVFQTFETSGRVIQLTAYESAAPAKPLKTRSLKTPGAGKFAIESISLSERKISAGDPFTLTARVAGKNIAYLFTEVLFHDKSLDQYYGPVMRDYVQAERTRKIGGVVRPVWDAAIEVSLRLRPRLRLLTDGVDFTFGFFLPKAYSDSDSQLDGLYTSADGVASRRARLTVDSAGATKNMLAFKGQGGPSMPSVLTLQPGDGFAPFVHILTRNEEAWQVKTALSTPLTFRGEAFHWMEEALMPGDYLAGLLVQDLDGGLTRKYTQLTVRE